LSLVLRRIKHHETRIHYSLPHPMCLGVGIQVVGSYEDPWVSIPTIGIVWNSMRRKAMVVMEKRKFSRWTRTGRLR
jgi:hypothetical protein